MAAGTYGFKLPEIFNPSGINPHTIGPIATSTSDSHVGGLCVKGWTKQGTNSLICYAGGNENLFGRVVSIRDPNNRWLNIQYVTAAQLLAHVYELVIEPCGGLFYQGTEDALGTPITDANSGSSAVTPVYCTFVAPVEPTVQDGNINPYGSPIQTILFDSSTVTTTAGTTSITLLGPVPNYGNRPYSATAGVSPRSFLFKVRAPQASQ